VRFVNATGAIDPTSGGPGSRAGTGTCATTDAGSRTSAGTNTGTDTHADSGADPRTGSCANAGPNSCADACGATSERLGIDRGQCEPVDVNRIQPESDQCSGRRNRYVAEQRQHDAYVHVEQRRMEFRSNRSGRIVQHAVQHRGELSVSLHDSPEYDRSRQRPVTAMEARHQPCLLTCNRRVAGENL